MSTAIKTRLLGSQSDERLLALARLGSEAAFEAIALRYRRPLLRRCRQLCLSEDRAQEVLGLTLAEAWSGVGGGAEAEDVRTWLHGIAQRIAVETMRDRGEAMAGSSAERTARAAAQPSGQVVPDAAPRPDEVLALRGALAAMSPQSKPGAAIVHQSDGEKPGISEENGFHVAGGAVRGLLRGARRGISALTPPPLLAWALGRASEGSGAGERIAEIGASGGGIGLAGLAVKGGIAAVTAAVAVTGATLVENGHAHRSAARHAAAAHRRVSVAASHGHPGPGASGGGTTSRSSVRSGNDLRRHHAARKRALTHHGDTSRSQPSQALKQAVAEAPSKGAGAPPKAGGAAPPSTGASTPAAGATPSQSAASSTQGSSSGSAPVAGSVSTTTTSTESSGSVTASGQASGGGAGIGVHVSVETGSGQSSSSGTSASQSGGSSGTAASSSTESKSSGVGIGISVSLEPLGSVGVHVSLP